MPKRLLLIGFAFSALGCASRPTTASSGNAGSSGSSGVSGTAEGGASVVMSGGSTSSVSGGGGTATDATDAGAGTSGTAPLSDAGQSSSADAGALLAPTGLLVELTGHPERARLTDATPEFAWIVNAAAANEQQTGYRILVASTQQKLDSGVGDVWDTGKVGSADSVNVSYAGSALAPSASYFWQVRSWDKAGAASPWSASQQFVMAAKLGTYSTPTPDVVQTPLPPATSTVLGTGHYLFDFSRAAFGWAELTINAPAAGAVVSVSLGEKAKGQAVDVSPGGSIRAAQVQVTLQQGLHTYRVATPKDATNTSAPAILLPAALGVVMPFRYLEVQNAPVALTADSVRQIAVTYPFDTSLSSFESDNALLNRVWAVSTYTVQATTFAGLYIDGDRERTPYEADAYIQQLGHYAIDRDYALARRSHEYLMLNPTWPTEWKFHSVMLAWADWMYTGNTESLAQQYALLKKEKTLEANLNADGLLDTTALRDIVDWPAGERDGYVLTGVNTVVNAFWCHILGLMSDMATALGNTSDATRYRSMQGTAIAAFNSKLFNASTGLYQDGQTSTHSSLHANMFPLAFGLVPAEKQAKVVAFVKSRGMACSVYGAQYLLEALYQAGEADAALALLTSTSDRSWSNMLTVGSTMTMEAWDAKYKPNLDWNHAWAAAPANILPRYTLGVRPVSPGFAQIVIQPQPGSLSHLAGSVATIRGPVRVVVDRAPFAMSVQIPVSMKANVAVPSSGTACVPLLDGELAQTTVSGGVSWINGVGSGTHVIRCQ